VRCTVTDAQRTARWLAIRTRFALGQIELAPSDGDRLRGDVLRLRKRVTQSGVRIDLPSTQDGRHCDYAPALMLVLSRYLDDVQPQAAGPAEDREVAEMRRWAERRYLRRGDEDDDGE
jgi:hypothetical protein